MNEHSLWIHISQLSHCHIVGLGGVGSGWVCQSGGQVGGRAVGWLGRWAV